MDLCFTKKMVLDDEFSEKINELVTQNKIHTETTWKQLVRNYQILSNGFIKNLKNQI